MTKTWKTKKLKFLARAFLSLENEKDMLAFLRDIATLEELDALSSRLGAAQMLHDGVPYRDIAKKTGMSTTTITRIANWLRHGEGGYRHALDNEKK